eukprot:scaffold6895_cov290-Prasinococcus_capsulatus_cf.AAC.1
MAIEVTARRRVGRAGEEGDSRMDDVDGVPTTRAPRRARVAAKVAGAAEHCVFTTRAPRVSVAVGARSCSPACHTAAARRAAHRVLGQVRPQPECTARGVHARAASHSITVLPVRLGSRGGGGGERGHEHSVGPRGTERGFRTLPAPKYARARERGEEARMPPEPRRAHRSLAAGACASSPPGMRRRTAWRRGAIHKRARVHQRREGGGA